MRVRTDKGTVYVLERNEALDGFTTPIRLDGQITCVRWGYDWVTLSQPKTLEPGDLFRIAEVASATS